MNRFSDSLTLLGYHSPDDGGTTNRSRHGRSFLAVVPFSFFLVRDMTAMRLVEGISIVTFVTIPETTVTSNKSYSYLHWVTIVMINSND